MLRLEVLGDSIVDGCSDVGCDFSMLTDPPCFTEMGSASAHNFFTTDQLCNKDVTSAFSIRNTICAILWTCSKFCFKRCQVQTRPFHKRTQRTNRSRRRVRAGWRGRGAARTVCAAGRGSAAPRGTSRRRRPSADAAPGSGATAAQRYSPPQPAASACRCGLRPPVGHPGGAKQKSFLPLGTINPSTQAVSTVRQMNSVIFGRTIEGRLT